MHALRSLMLAVAAIAIGSSFALAQVDIGPTNIGGTVTGPKGPEAGVWVIAETRDLPIRFIRIVVTDDQGRYLVPDLPQASYDVWVRGYGLVDSNKVRSAPGQTINHTAVIAPTPQAAAQYYPAIYWYTMMRLPPADAFNGKSEEIPASVSLGQWLNGIKNNGCIGCHQIGQLSTRTIPTEFGTGADGWLRRIQSGQAGELMVNIIAGELGGAPLKYFGDWTDRVAKGELPATQPPRPQGVERNIVVTLRDWMNEKQYLHDLIASDRRNPTVNAYGPLYGSPEYSSDDMPILDPVRNTATSFHLPTAPGTPEALGPGHAAMKEPLQASHYWGMEKIWNTKANNHNSMFDEKGRLWLSATGQGPDNPDFCKKGSDHPSAKIFPLERSNRRVTMFDPKTQEYKAIATCFGTHHLQFGYDANNTLWTSGGGPVVGWINTKMLDETGDQVKSQGWTPLILDTNGNGKRDDYVEPNQPVDPTKDKRIVAGFYAVMPNVTDGSVWGTYRAYPGAIVRLNPGSDPNTTLAEIYNVPAPGFGARGGDIDKKGVVWVSLASGHLGAFDRSKCKAPLNGPNATGNHCPEGWTLYQYPGPGFEGIGRNSAESSYYSWVDQHNTFGLGEDVPMSTGNLNDGILALKDETWITLRVPYPLGFYAKGFDGRIDDPKAGWKGRGLWAANGDRTPWLIEGGKGSRPLAAHFQLRPDPLAR
ncbi:MAG TPA: carboxypeptidase-like regulatory domain-containing protein [Beijerinckiaceae bacterium]|jgi:hypothetical protein|nr:carboxypeptidase-like regulatory domain-containing protein [Beijerinckiaceae bacterium]